MRAIEDGKTVIRTEQLGSPIRELVKTALPTTADLYPVKCSAAKYIPVDEWTEGERQFVRFGKWLAERLMLPEPDIFIFDAPRANCEADSALSATRIRVNRSGVGNTFFDKPRLALWLPLIIHELGHRTGEGHDAVFWREVERLSGEAAQAVVDHSPSLDQFGL